jgi:hypothetical protein
MFLKELWVFNRKAALAFMLFILSWVYINYRQGAVVAPLFQYGMYSGKFFIADTQQVVRLYANNSLVDFTKYSLVERDMMEISLTNYIHQKKVNEVVFNSIKRILSKFAIGRLMHEEDYTNNISDKDFMQWYKRLLEKDLGYPINKLDAYMQKYTWQKDSFVPIDTPSKINCVAVN